MDEDDQIYCQILLLKEPQRPQMFLRTWVDGLHRREEDLDWSRMTYPFVLESAVHRRDVERYREDYAKYPYKRSIRDEKNPGARIFEVEARPHVGLNWMHRLRRYFPDAVEVVQEGGREDKDRFESALNRIGSSLCLAPAWLEIPERCALFADANIFAVLDYVRTWAGPHTLTLAPAIRAKWTWAELEATPAALAAIAGPAIAEAEAARKASYAVCTTCGTNTPPEYMAGDGECDPCFCRRTGAVH